MELKKCTKCKKEFPKTEEYFRKIKGKNKLKSGEVKEYFYFQGECKKCEALRYKKYYKENKEKIALYYKENKEKIALYYKENKEKIALRAKKYHKENKKKIDLYNKKYQKENKEKIALYHKKYQKEYQKKLPDFYVARFLGKPVAEIPKEILETKRLIIKIRRELK